jgi:hypothetical protein
MSSHSTSWPAAESVANSSALAGLCSSDTLSLSRSSVCAAQRTSTLLTGLPSTAMAICAGAAGAHAHSRAGARASRPHKSAGARAS